MESSIDYSEPFFVSILEAPVYFIFEVFIFLPIKYIKPRKKIKHTVKSLLVTVDSLLQWKMFSAFPNFGKFLEGVQY